MAVISKISNGGNTYDIRDKILGIIGSGAPTGATVGTVGQIYEDSTNGILYICKAAGSGAYTWERVGKDPILYSTTGQNTNGAMTQKATTDALDNKVDKVTGKGLSTNDYTTAEKNKLAGIAEGAEVNVNADWNATSGDAQILNRPNLADVATSGSYNDLADTPEIPEVKLYGSTGQNTDGAMTQKAVSDELAAINGLVPSEATTTNQLADKAFVNSSIATNTANFLGTKDAVDDLDLEYGATTAQIVTALNAYPFASKTNNDYVFVVNEDAHGNVIYQRFKYQEADSTFAYEYTLNNSSFTAAQWATINSGMTTTHRTKLEGIEEGAEKNVQADWNQTNTAADDYIKNKPVIPEGAKLYNTTGQNTDGAMTQKAVTDEFGNYLAKSGGTMTGAINMGTKAITNLAAPTNNTDAATKKYVDDTNVSITVQGETLTIL